MLKRAVLCLAVVSFAVTAALVSAQPPPGGGGGAPGAPGGPGRGPGDRGRGMMGAMMYLERTWTAVSFQLGCTGDQLTSLRPTYQNALATREAAVKKAVAAKNWQAVGKAMQDCKTRLETKLKQVLSKQQWTKLQQLVQPPTPRPRPAGQR